MRKVKVYVVVCSYILDEGIVDIDLDTMLKRLLRLEPRIVWYGTEYDIRGVIQWNFDHIYKVKYGVVRRQLDPSDCKEEEMIGRYSYRGAAQQLADEMNLIHDRLFFGLSEEDAKTIFKTYGNNYTRQTTRKGG